MFFFVGVTTVRSVASASARACARGKGEGIDDKDFFPIMVRWLLLRVLLLLVVVVPPPPPFVIVDDDFIRCCCCCCRGAVVLVVGEVVLDVVVELAIIADRSFVVAQSPAPLSIDSIFDLIFDLIQSTTR